MKIYKDDTSICYTLNISDDMILVVQRFQDENKSLRHDIQSLRRQLEEAEEGGRTSEQQLLQEIDMLHEKNSVLSNLLDIVHERADNAEKELEKQYQVCDLLFFSLCHYVCLSVCLSHSVSFSLFVCLSGSV